MLRAMADIRLCIFNKTEKRGDCQMQIITFVSVDMDQSPYPEGLKPHMHPSQEQGRSRTQHEKATDTRCQETGKIHKQSPARLPHTQCSHQMKVKVYVVPKVLTSPATEQQNSCLHYCRVYRAGMARMTALVKAIIFFESV